jgi:hypothetical protein
MRSTLEQQKTQATKTKDVANKTSTVVTYNAASNYQAAGVSANDCKPASLANRSRRSSKLMAGTSAK